MREQGAAVVALDVFNRADGQPITMSMVQRRRASYSFAQACQKATAASRARMTL
jgi:hypothetical protein